MIREEARLRFNLRQRNKSVVEFPNELCVLMAEQVGGIHLHYSLNDKLKVELTMWLLDRVNQLCEWAR